MAAAAIPAVIAGLSALGGLFGNRKSTAKATTKGTQVTDRTATSTPTYDPNALAMRNALMSTFMGRISPSYARTLADDITTGNIQNINRGFGAGQRALQEALAGRGLNFGPLSAVLGAESNNNRIGALIQALNQRRLLADQLQTGALEGASNFFSRLPVGRTDTEKGTVTTDSMTEQTNPGNMLGGAFGGLGTSLAGILGASGGFGRYGGLNIPGGPPINAGDIYGGTLPGSQLPINFPGFPSVMQGSLMGSLFNRFFRR